MGSTAEASEDTEVFASNALSEVSSSGLFHIVVKALADKCLGNSNHETTCKNKVAGDDHGYVIGRRTLQSFKRRSKQSFKRQKSTERGWQLKTHKHRKDTLLASTTISDRWANRYATRMFKAEMYCRDADREHEFRVKLTFLLNNMLQKQEEGAILQLCKRGNDARYCSELKNSIDTVYTQHNKEKKDFYKV